MTWQKTRWGLVDLLRDGSVDERSEALGEIIAIYGPPLLALARHRHSRLSREDCEDIVADFFVKCIAKPVLQQADPARGRFRNFLAKSFQYFALNWVRDRSPRVPLASLEELLDRHHQAYEPRTDESPEDTYIRVLRLALFDYTLTEFEKACRAAGQDKKFEIFLRREIDPLRGATAPSYATLAADFGMPSEDAVGRIVRAARDEFESRLLAQITSDSESAAEAEAELRLVMACGAYGGLETPVETS